MQRIKRQFFGEVLRNVFDLKTAKDIVEILGGWSKDIGEKRKISGRVVASNETSADPSMVTLEISRPAEILYMSTPAAWICMIILAYLIISSAILGVASGNYNRMPARPTSSIADVAALVAGSTRLLELAKYRSVSDVKSDDCFRARLGWFRDAEGRRR
ncbi:hypothetical protein F5B18DRAFT_469977 [Nemania serpens]|nr:hypothetical protein F5B18DRAFT_469977 [Nemania serpens]